LEKGPKDEVANMGDHIIETMYKKFRIRITFHKNDYWMKI